MPVVALLFSLAAQLQGPGSQCPVLPIPVLPVEPLIYADPVRVGWHDELNKSKTWSPLAVENKPKVSVPFQGAMRLTLGKVPAGWPYEYQWSGVQRDATVDIARHPYLTANVSQLLGGYAHMDVDILDASGNAVKGFRSSTLQAGGVLFLDFKNQLDPAVYRMRIRLIVGGSNEGCYATYNWIRFTSTVDGERLQKSPDQLRLIEDKKN